MSAGDVPFQVPIPHQPETNEPVRVAVVDDHAAISSMITQFVNSKSGYRVVGEAPSVAEAVQLCKEGNVHVVVLDVALMDGSGVLFLDELRREKVDVRVLVFSGNVSARTVRELLERDVLGIVEKSASLETFFDALQAVATGRIYFGTRVNELIKTLVVKKQPFAREPTEILTARELDVLRHLATGLSSKEIAAKLGLSVHTVINHRSSLMRKTGLRKAAQLSRYAERAGLVSL